MAEKILKRLLSIILGLAWGVVSFFWLGYSILTLGNFMEELGSLDYVAEGESIVPFPYFFQYFPIETQKRYFSYINENTIYIVF